MKKWWKKEVLNLQLTESDEHMREECISYFKNAPIWNKLLKGFWKKYISYGDFSGTVKLSGLSGQDIEELEGFFGTSYHGQRTISISAIRFCKELRKSRFSEVSPEQLLELYFGEKPVARREQEKNFQQIEKDIRDEWKNFYQGTPAGGDDVSGGICNKDHSRSACV